MGVTTRMFAFFLLLPGAFACKSAGPNQFEIKSSFSVDTLWFGSRKFKDCTELHRLIGERKLDEIWDKSAWLTNKVVNSVCKYDSWNDVSPLWMVVSWRCSSSGGKWDALIKKLIEAGASAERGFGYKAKPIERARNDEIRELIRKHACKTVPVKWQENCNQMPFDHL